MVPFWPPHNAALRPLTHYCLNSVHPVHNPPHNLIVRHPHSPRQFPTIFEFSQLRQQFFLWVSYFTSKYGGVLGTVVQ
jgi:hypothetical protein